MRQNPPQAFRRKMKCIIIHQGHMGFLQARNLLTMLNSVRSRWKYFLWKIMMCLTAQAERGIWVIVGGAPFMPGWITMECPGFGTGMPP